MTFKERLERYKKEEDFFVVDVYKGGVDPYETIRDLTWDEVQRRILKAKEDENVSGIEVFVEDWYSDDGTLFKFVCGVNKKPFRFNINRAEKTVTATAWRM